MSEIASARINSFAHVAQQANAQLPEEPIFVLTSSQLERIVSRTVTSAIEPLLARIKALEDVVALQDEKLVALEATQEVQAENQLIQLQLINDLRKDHEPQPLQRDRGEILRALVAANGGKMLAKEARQKMRLDKPTFSRLLDILSEYVESKPFHQDKRQLVLILKNS